MPENNAHQTPTVKPLQEPHPRIRDSRQKDLEVAIGQTQCTTLREGRKRCSEISSQPISLNPKTTSFALA
ncbi:hypothetical protein [Entomobacter blattae]|uniref:Uncharacterized protein n=1 Tax=Entomobacter blattae TaxID=2762277 RepID=A0A7H1NUD9_9PROT|nr:hypothetical protein [Entomobacter blattae]QNT79399.1 hypothetical protein JGUZn3_21980 [Entomobacter blattae]